MNVGSIDLSPRTLFHGRGTVSCLPMNVYLSHNTALLFWRAWSAAAAIPLCVFHDLGVADASLFPATLFPTSEVLRNEAVLSRDVRTILEDALQSLAGAVTRVRWPRRTVLRRLRPPSAGCSRKLPPWRRR